MTRLLYSYKIYVYDCGGLGYIPDNIHASLYNIIVTSNMYATLPRHICGIVSVYYDSVHWSKYIFLKVLYFNLLRKDLVIHQNSVHTGVRGHAVSVAVAVAVAVVVVVSVSVAVAAAVAVAVAEAVAVVVAVTVVVDVTDGVYASKMHGTPFRKHSNTEC